MLVYYKILLACRLICLTCMFVGFSSQLIAANSGVNSAGRVQIRILEIKGNQRIEDETIRALLVQSDGGGFTEENINDSVKRLYESGYFSDVTIKVRGSVLQVNVVENPSINRVGFEGNDEIEDDLLKAEIGILPRQSLTQSRIKHAVTRIQRLY
ncbi:MAG: POTRA domain-containing protein, partial [Bacteroidota bacterium]